MLQITNGILAAAPGSTLKEQVKQHASPNRSGALIKPTVLIVHDTASGLETNGPVSWLCNPDAKASAHFVVGRLGFEGNDVHQLVPTNVKAWHAGKSSYLGQRNVNNFSIGIEIVNPGWLTSKDGGKTGTFSRGAPSWNALQYGIHQMTDDSHPGGYYWMSYTTQQLDAVIEMGRAIVAAYPSIKAVEGHFTISPGRKVDVNPLFPMGRIRTAIFSARGPVSQEKHVETDEEKNIPDLPPASLEKDEEFDFDAVTTSNLNLRPWPDSPNRVGVIRIDKPIDIIRQTVSQKYAGTIWYFVRVKKEDITVEKGMKADADGNYSGFVHSQYVRLVS